ncbi:S1 family peptidase [Pseudomonas viridiflava]|uniref:S1 family peptidase n=1 Tax=Pseudomonas viridiflava TaxID=33069 RepID=UPI000F025A86|nr:serine protease [Pseudomonas viridiflava]
MQVNTLAEQLFFTTVRIDTVSVDAQQGSGTGFFVRHNTPEGELLVIVTNKHVVHETNTGHLSFLKRVDNKPTLGDGFKLSFGPQEWPEMWFGHPDPDVDIAICPLSPILSFAKEKYGYELFVRTIDTDMIPTVAQVRELDAIEPVTFIGYPNGIWDSKNLLPVARRGTTATPIEVDFEGTPRFLIDASVFGGSSGSPVFILNQGSFSRRDGGLVAGNRLYFIGVVAAVFFRTSYNKIISVPIPTQHQPMAKQDEMIDLGVVIKSRTVVETIEAARKRFIAVGP